MLCWLFYTKTSHIADTTLIHLSSTHLTRDKTTAEEASKLFPRDLFTYAQEHKLLEPVLVSDEQLTAIRTGTPSTGTDAGAGPSGDTAAVAST